MGSSLPHNTILGSHDQSKIDLSWSLKMVQGNITIRKHDPMNPL